MRLLLENVQAGARDSSRLERLDQSRFVHDFAARRVDEESRGFEHGEFTGADAKAKTFGMLLIEYHAAKSDFQLSAGGSPAVGNVLRVSCPAAARASG